MQTIMQNATVNTMHWHEENKCERLPKLHADMSNVYMYIVPGVTIIFLVPTLQLQMLCLSQLLLSQSRSLPLFVFVCLCLFFRCWHFPPAHQSDSVCILLCLISCAGGPPVLRCVSMAYHILIPNTFRVKLKCIQQSETSVYLWPCYL